MAYPVAVVTGAAGFIGSHVVESLLDAGWNVRGIDCFTDNYSPDRKLGNITSALASSDFELVEVDLASADVAIEPMLSGAGVIIHLAAEPGVRSSWGQTFGRYVQRNVLATQRLLEASRAAIGLQRIIVASSSSVYGDAIIYPTPEEAPLFPRSPYGVTKLASEQLARAYATNWSLPTISLRFFTVFGPRQRPDMAFSRLIESVLLAKRFPLFGLGDQVRDFTYVSDAVGAVQACIEANVPPGSVFNIAGGSATSLRAAIDAIEQLTGKTIQVDIQAAQPGDPLQTGGDITAAQTHLNWEPSVGLTEGLAHQIAWQQELVLPAETSI